MDSVKRRERNDGIDLLRIISMFMVLVLHLLGQGGILTQTAVLSGQYKMAWFLEIAAYCAVNCYALISGYVSINSKFKYTSIITLWLRIVFYTVTITTICKLIFPASVGKSDFIRSIFPVMTSEYWYVTAYFCLFFFIPFINAAINRLTQGQTKAFVIALVLIFSVLPTVCSILPGIFPHDVFGTSNGYSALWLIVLYIIGAYLKKYNVLGKLKVSKALMGYLISITATWLVKILLEVGEQRAGAVEPVMLLIDYTSPTILAAAVFLLILFEKITIWKKLHGVIQLVSPLAFSVYLIHVHHLVWNNALSQSVASFAQLPVPLLVLAVLGTALAIFTLCCMIDFVRDFIFKKINVNGRVSQWEQKHIGDLWNP